MARRSRSPSRARRAGSNVRPSRSSARSGSRVQQHIERMRAMGAPGFRRMPGQSAGMSRGQFLRTAGVGAGMAALAGAGVVHAQTLPIYYETVVGHNDPDHPEYDVDALQNAVDYDTTQYSGAVITLQGTFFLGDDDSSTRGTVEITRDNVTMTTDTGATISGGSEPFGPFNVGAIRISEAKNTVIEHLTFDGHRMAGIGVWGCKGNTILRNNTFLNGHEAHDYHLNHGIMLLGSLSGPPNPGYVFEGSILVENNEFVPGELFPGEDHWSGFALWNITDHYSPSLTIRGNRFRSTNRKIAISWGMYLGGAKNTQITIEDNVLEEISYGIRTSSFYDWAGPSNMNVSNNQVTSWERCILLAGSSSNPSTNNTVFNNTLIKTPHAFNPPWWNGALAFDYCDNCFISKNIITVKDSTTAPGATNSAVQLWYSNNNLLTGNDITCELGTYSGFYVFTNSGYNVLQGNKVSGIVGYPFYLTDGAHDTVMHGNNITGVTELTWKNPEFNPYCVSPPDCYPPGQDCVPQPGVPFTAPEMYEVAGQISNALDFRGYDEAIALDSPSLDVTGSITLSAWFNTSSETEQFFVGKGWAWGGPYSLSFRGDLGGYVMFRLGDGGGSQNCPGGENLNDGQWHYAVGTYDGSVMKLYIDGVLVNDVPYVWAGFSDDSSLQLGSVAWGSPLNLTGQLDEVAIWDVDLSLADIENLWNSGNGLPADQIYPANLMAYYNCDSIDKTNLLHVLHDLSGNGNDAIINETSCPSCPPDDLPADCTDPTYFKYLPGVNVFLDPTVTNNTLRGYSGESVIDLPGEVHVPQEVLFGNPNTMIGPYYGIYWGVPRTSDDQATLHYDYSGYEYVEENPAEPIAAFQYVSYGPGIEVLLYQFPGEWVGFPGYDVVLKVTVNLVETETKYTLPWGAQVPDPAGVPLVTTKDNWITGFDTNTLGGGGIGQQVSLWKMNMKYIKSMQAMENAKKAQKLQEDGSLQPLWE